MQFIELTSPFSAKEVAALRAGDYVKLSGTIYTGRDAAHKRLTEALNIGAELPIRLEGQGIYYVGPCFKDNIPVSAGPTTSARMDAYASLLYDLGIKVTIGKGDRTQSVYQAIVNNGAVYLAAIGGAGAVYADCIRSAAPIAYEDLGTEAIFRLDVVDFPAIVAIDSLGCSIYKRDISR